MTGAERPERPGRPGRPSAAPLVRAGVAGGIGTITLDSPHNANALSTGLVSQLHAALDAGMKDPAVRVIVLTGAGRVFCSGADLKEARTSPGAAPSLMTGVIQLIWEGPKPVIGRINGAARAGGIGLVAACDIAIAPDEATFAFSEVRIGVVPAVISVPCLRRMPSRAAAEYFLTGEVFGARRAAEIGLLTRAVPAAELDSQTARYAGLLARGGPAALAATKQVLGEGQGRSESVGAGLARMAELSGRFFGSDEAREGMSAFAAKRDPAWVPAAAPAPEAAPVPEGTPVPLAGED
jgi:methylglutaconyl-CoA hydratase